MFERFLSGFKTKSNSRITATTLSHALMVRPLEDRVTPAVFTVNSLLDTASPTDGYLSLRQAISIVNSDTLPGDLSAQIQAQIAGGLHEDGNDYIVFNAAAVDGPIVLSGSQLSLTLAGTTAKVTIDGGEGVTIDGNNASRVIEVGAGVNAVFSNLTVTRGNVSSGFGEGGAGIMNAGKLSILSGDFTANRADHLYEGSGGAILNKSGGELRVVNTSFVGNSTDNSGQGGGGIFNDGGTLTVVGSTFSGNSAVNGGGGGGAIAQNYGTLTVIDSTFSGNFARFGGAIFFGNGTGTIVGSTITDNHSSNFGTVLGGGIYTFGGLTLVSTIVAGNDTTGDADINGSLAEGTRDNLIGDGTGMSGATDGFDGNRVGTSLARIDPLLGPLADNGGPTLTHALLAGSPAIGTGGAPTSLAVALDNEATTLTVARAINLGILPGSTVLQIGGERLLVTGVSGDVLTVTRAYDGTQAAAHAAGEPVSLAYDQRGVLRAAGGPVDVGSYQSAPRTAAPTVTSPSASQTVPGGTYAVEGTAVAGSLVKVYSDANNNGIIDAGDAVVAQQQLGAGITAYSVSVPLTTGAANHFLVTATSTPQLESSPVGVPTIVEDSTAPVAPTVTSPTAPESVDSATYNLTGTAEAGSLVRVYADTNGSGTLDGGDTLVAQQQLGIDGAFSVSVPLTQDAANRFFVTATDAAGNASAATGVPTITEDSVDPAMPVVSSPAVPLDIDAPSYKITGTAEAGSLVEVYADTNGNGEIDEGETLVGVQKLGSGIADFSISVPLTQDAANRFLVTSTDAAGNVSSIAVVPTITEDSTAPAAPTVTSPTIPVSLNAPGLNLTGTAEAGSVVNIYRDTNGNGVIDGGDTLVGVQQLGSGIAAYSISVPLTQDAANRFLVTSTDAAGNVSAIVAVPTITEDSTAPAAPTVTSPTTPYTTNFPIAFVAGTAEAGSLVRVYADTNADGIIDDGDPLLGVQQLGVGLTAFSIDVALTQDAANRFLVTSTDTAGNVSAAAAVPTITEDSTAPVAPTVTSPTTPYTTNFPIALVAGTAEAGSLVNIYRDTNADGILDGGDTLVAQMVATSGSYSISVPLTQDAANRFLVNSTDAAGNVSAVAVVPTITEDSTAPVAPTVTSPATFYVVNSETALVAGTAEAGSLVNIYRDTNADGILDGGDTLVAQQQLEIGIADYAYVVPLTQDAANRFLVTSTDTAGNVSAIVAVPTITEDSTAPAAPTVTSPTTPYTTNFPIAFVAGTAEANSLVNIYRDTNADGILDGGDTLVGVRQPGTDGAFSFVLPLTPNAVNRFLVTSTDAAGNVSAVAVVPTITEDSTAPAAPTVTSPETALVTNSETALVAGIAEAGSLVRVYADTNADGTLDGGDTLIGVQQLDTGTSDYSIAVPLTQDAANRFLVTATDAAGNESAIAAVPTITEDSTAPVAPTVTSPTAPQSVDSATIIIAGTAEAGSLVRVYADTNADGILDGGDTIVGQTVATSGSYSISVPLTQDAANRFLVTSTDTAGNVSAIAAVPTITEDSTAPLAPTVTGPATSYVVNSATFNLNGTAEAGSLVQVYADANHNGILDEGDNLVSLQQLGAGLTAFSIDVPLMQDTANRFFVTSADAVGHVSVPTEVPTITEDSTAPLAPTVTSPATSYVANSASYTVSGVAEAGSLVNIYRDTNADGTLDGGDTLVAQQQLGIDGAFSIAVPLMQDAANRFLVNSTDAAGNESAIAAVPTITEDSTAPVAATVTGPASALTVETITTFTVTGTAEAGSLVEVYRDTNDNGLLDAGDALVGRQQLTDGTGFAVEVSLLENSDNHFLVTSTDVAGNVSPVAVVPAVTQVSNAPVSGVVFLDYNADGIRNGEDIGLGGRLVFIDTDGNGIAGPGERSALTDGNGAWRIDGVGPGAHTIRVELFPSEVRVGLPANEAIDVTAGRPVTGADLGLRKINPAFAVATTTDVFAGDNPDARTALVRGLYQGILGRAGTDGEIRAWSTGAMAGVPVGELAADFLRSAEYLGNQVDGCFRVFLAREADAAGRAYWVDQLSRGTSYEQMAVEFLSSEEYRGLHPDSADFVRSLYRSELGREGTDAEVADTVASIDAGASRRAIARGFVESREAYLRAIDSLYAQFLNRPGEDAGREGWLEFVQSGGRLTDMAVQFVELTEFNQRAAESVN